MLQSFGNTLHNQIVFAWFLHDNDVRDTDKTGLLKLNTMSAKVIQYL